MDRKEIKEEAKSKIKGNKWKLLWPVLLIGLVGGILTSFCLPKTQTTELLTYNTDIFAEMSLTSTILYTIFSLIISIVSVGYKKYVLNFIRTGKCSFNDIIDCVKEKWLNILIISILMELIIGLGFALLIIPGVILALMLQMTQYLVIDTKLDAIESMKESSRMMKGYKWNYFVFVLSFLGWGLLAGFTFCILLIWLIPYVTVADAIYYDKLKKIQKVK